MTEDAKRPEKPSEELLSRASAEPLQETLATRLKGTNLFLVGMMGAGKTTVGRIIAKRLGYRFFDTDAVVEQAAGRSIAEIFAASGEAAFRQLETQVLGQLAAYKQLAIATGGGIVLDRQNWSYLHHGIVVWLDVPIDILSDRLRGSTTRPLLHEEHPQEKLRTLLNQRQHLYAQADVRVVLSVPEPPNRVANRVLMAVEQALRSPIVPPAPNSENMFS